MAATFTKEEFFNNFEIEKMNKNSLTVINRRTLERLFVSRNVFNTIMNNRAERMAEEEIQMPNGRVVKWLGIVTTMIF